MGGRGDDLAGDGPLGQAGGDHLVYPGPCGGGVHQGAADSVGGAYGKEGGGGGPADAFGFAGADLCDLAE